ncbi:MAG: NYN domain-containing protein [Phycisphaerae bacterium]
MNVICYVDGFNLYHGLKSKGWKKYYWLDLWALAERFLHPGQVLVEVVYCTAKVKDDVPALQRQLGYIDALQTTRTGVKVIYGHYLAKQVKCFNCGNTYTRHEEKMTDVNIACRVLTDAMDGRFDVALLVSGDSDLVPPVKIVQTRWPEKRVVVLFPPGRKSDALQRAVGHRPISIGEDKLRHSLLPDEVEVAPGKIVRRPMSWY